MITFIKWLMLKHRILKIKLLMWQFVDEAVKNFLTPDE